MNDKAIQNLIFFASNSAIHIFLYYNSLPLLLTSYNKLLSLVAMASATFSVAKPSLQVLFHLPNHII